MELMLHQLQFFTKGISGLGETHFDHQPWIHCQSAQSYGGRGQLAALYGT